VDPSALVFQNIIISDLIPITLCCRDDLQKLIIKNKITIPKVNNFYQFEEIIILNFNHNVVSISL